MRSTACIVPILLGCALTAAWGQSRYFINTVAGSNPIGDNGPASQALLWNPSDVAVDTAGNIYIADTANHRIRKMTGGAIRTIAGTGVAGYTGEGGTATLAECNSPGGIAVDAVGIVYFSDSGNQRVRKIGLDGKISLFAGDGAASSAGDGGAAISASLNNPQGLAIDAAGDLYIADMNNHRIRRITPDGKIATVAGTGSAGFAGDNGPAIQAKIDLPRAVAFDSLGRILIADMQNNRIRRFTLGGVITTMAGGKAGFGGDNNLATAALMSKPAGVAVNRQGTVYISDAGNQRIRAVTTDGFITTVAGSVAGFRGDTSSAAEAWLNNPQGIAADGQGNIYFADTSNHRVRAIFLSHIINTVAGYGHYAGDNGPATSAVLTNPSFVTLDKSGNLLVSDQDNHVVRKIDTSGKITTIAGTGIAGSLGDGGPALSAQLNSPQGLAVDNVGNVYVVDAVNSTVRMITPGGEILKIAGGGTVLNDGGAALKAKLNAPHGIAVDGRGDIYVADTNNNRVRQITTDGNIHTIIGDGVAQDNGDGGPATGAEVNRPWDVKVASDGTVYFSEFNGGRVRTISNAGIAGTIGFLNGNDTGIAIDSAAGIIVAGANQILSVAPSGINTRIAGGATKGFSGDGGPGLNALLNSPVGVAADAKGNIYFCDQLNNRIRKLTPDVASQVVRVSGNQQTAPLGAVLPLPFIVQVNGATGLPLPGVTVAFSIASGGGALGVGQAVTGSDGQARVTLTLPLVAGVVTMDAIVPGFSPVEFTATAVNMPGSISILRGNNQAGIPGSTLQQTLAVTVLGLDKKPFASAPVTFAVTSGSAKLNPTSVQTAADGSAATQATLGAATGSVTVSATVTGVPSAVFSLSSTAVASPQIFARGVVGAGLSTPPVQTVSPNAIISIFGQNFAPAGTLRTVSGADLVNGSVPTNLAGVCVLFGTSRAPMFVVTPNQLNVQVPQVTSPGASAVQVIANCDSTNQVFSSTQSVALQQASPEFFYAANSGTGANPVAAVDGVSGAPIGPGFALAYPGETVTIYATGLGLTNPAFATGQLPPTGAQVDNVAVSIDGAALDPSAILYAGVVPLNAGLYQLNIVLPASLTNGEHAIRMAVAGQNSPAGYISVGPAPQQ